MHDSRSVFRTGRYHRRFARNHIHVIRVLQLRAYYRASSQFIYSLDWPHPFSQKTPRVLLCGTASPYTTVTFARFIREHNRAARIDVLDISPYALSRSRKVVETCRDLNRDGIAFIEGDALSMPFTDEYFDWIETDFLLQFFSPEEKRSAFKEWYRVLKPGGIVTTRDWLYQRGSFSERIVEYTKNWFMRHTLGPIAYSAGAREVKETLREIGFEVALFPIRLPVIHSRIPLMSYVIMRKL